MTSPRVVLTVANPAAQSDPAAAERKNRRYVEALLRAGAEPIPLSAGSGPDERSDAFATMDGLLLTGGTDVDPARYGAPPSGSHPPEPGRDGLDEEAFRAATAASLPILGICRGLQLINVLEGGSLIQHLEGHESPSYPLEPVTRHSISIDPGSRLSGILDVRGSLIVNSYHHQAVAGSVLAGSLRASAVFPDATHGELVEGLEAVDAARWLLAVQCHPERTESTPPELEALWTAFVNACRRSAVGEPGA